jgi:hypothetical protein
MLYTKIVVKSATKRQLVTFVRLLAWYRLQLLEEWPNPKAGTIDLLVGGEDQPAILKASGIAFAVFSVDLVTIEKVSQRREIIDGDTPFVWE